MLETNESIVSFGNTTTVTLVEAPVGTPQYDVVKEQLIAALKDKTVNMAIYPDGGGMADGCTIGIHAYFTDATAVPEVTDKTAGDTGYKSKGSKQNKLLATFDISGHIEGTSNVGELTALLQSLQLIVDLRKAGISFKYVNLYQDSMYALDSYRSWMMNWARNGWKKRSGDAPANLDILKALLEIKQELKVLAQRVMLNWVKGHGDDPGNIAADALATKAKMLSMGSYKYHVVCTDVVMVGKPEEVLCQEENKVVSETPPELALTWEENEPNPFIRQSSYYFVTGSTAHNPMRKLMFANLAKDALFGERHPGNGYAIAILPEPDPVIARIEKVAEKCNQIGQVCEITLKPILVKKTYEGIVKATNEASIELLEQQLSLKHSEVVKTTNLAFAEKPLMSVLNPPLRALIALRFFNELDSIITQFIEGALDNDKNVSITDVTDQFFVLDTTGKKPVMKIVPTFTNADKMIQVKAKLFKERDTISSLPMVVGTDIPLFNSIGALKKLNPKVSVIAVRENHDAVRYYTVFKADCGIGIYASLHANFVCRLDKQ